MPEELKLLVELLQKHNCYTEIATPQGAIWVLRVVGLGEVSDVGTELILE
jgi:hypothetical protein